VVGVGFWRPRRSWTGGVRQRRGAVGGGSEDGVDDDVGGVKVITKRMEMVVFGVERGGEELGK